MEICRLCCTSNFVNNEIFDEESALYIKMSLYLPIKVYKNDRLPQKICDKCSCKVNDFYQFCNEAIEVQQKLQTSLKILNIPIPSMAIDAETKNNHIHSKYNDIIEINCTKNSRSTQTELQDYSIQVKQELPPSPPAALSPKLEEEYGQDYEEDINYSDYNNCEVPSDDSDIYLHRLKNKKVKVAEKKPKKSKEIDHNGEVKNNRKEKKRKHKLEQQLQDIVNQAVLPAGTTISLKQEAEEMNLDMVKIEPVDEEDMDFFGLEPSQWKCCICFDSKLLKTELLMHYKNHASRYEGHNSRSKSPVMADGVIKCPTCDKMFHDKINWLRHDNSCHGKRPYQCSLCEKSFREATHILKHGLTHTYTDDLLPASKRYVCDLCPEEFVYRKSLIEHRSSHPEAQERKLLYNCLECGRGFAHSNSLRRHRRSHTGERNFLCNVCGKAMSNREHLKFHIRIHTGYKPNICKTCGKGFAKKCNLTLHERVHTGEKPHVCSHCGKAFSQRSTLVIHERYHSGARPYVCTLCGRGFVAKGLLSMHLKTTCI